MSAQPSQPSSDSGVRKFYGKYRGKVLNNADPHGLGRVLVEINDVSTSMPSSWAMPCFPWGGAAGGVFSVPQPGAWVWIEFEQGNPDDPIWTGCFARSQLDIASDAQPSLSVIGAAFPGYTIQTPGRNVMQVSDLPGPTGGIQLRSSSGAMISVTNLGITISNGQGAMITLVGNTTDINSGGLTVI